MKRKRDGKASRNTKNQELEGKGKRIEGKRWEEPVLVLMRGKASRGADVVDMRRRRGIWDTWGGMGSEGEGWDEFGDLVLVPVGVERRNGGIERHSG